MKPEYKLIICKDCGDEFTGHRTAWFCSKCRDKSQSIKGASRATTAVRQAIQKGLLKPPADCECVDCGGRARVYDHRDYSRPLDVSPVCYPCNYKRGPAVYLQKEYKP